MSHYGNDVTEFVLLQILDLEERPGASSTPFGDLLADLLRVPLWLLGRDLVILELILVLQPPPREVLHVRDLLLAELGVWGLRRRVRGGDFAFEERVRVEHGVGQVDLVPRDLMVADLLRTSLMDRKLVRC